MINAKQFSSATDSAIGSRHKHKHTISEFRSDVLTIGRMVLLENRYTLQEQWGTIGSILWEHITARKPIIQHLPLPCYDELALAIALTISSCFACSILKCYFSIQSLLAVCFSVFPTLSQSHSVDFLALLSLTFPVRRVVDKNSFLWQKTVELNLLFSNKLHKQNLLTSLWSKPFVELLQCDNTYIISHFRLRFWTALVC